MKSRSTQKSKDFDDEIARWEDEGGAVPADGRQP